MSEDDDGPCTDCGGTGITYQTERRCSCQPPMNSPSEERVTRAREVMIAELRRAGVRAPLDPTIQPFLEAGVRAILAFADEGSGIGGLREALEQSQKLLRTAIGRGIGGGSCNLCHTVWLDADGGAEHHNPGCQIEINSIALATSSPDIDRSGLAQEVE